MANSKDDSFRARLHALKQRLRDLEAAIPKHALRAEIGESYVRELERLTESEAAEHLRRVDDSRVLGAYLILSGKVERAILAEICLAYLRRPGRKARLTGAHEIGICLKRTFNRDVSRELALMIRNPEEDDEIRCAAYSSLLLINCGAGSGVPPEVFKQQEGDTTLKGIDWRIVDSFLWQAQLPPQQTQLTEARDEDLGSEVNGT